VSAKRRQEEDKAAAPAPEPKRARKARPCPICSKMSLERYHPFCSKRCADIDLGRWLGGTYTIPAEEQPDFIDPTAPEHGDGEDDEEP
jgi:endogenous inhibitor of DNA gyrase (YacG/DUF329 family)